MSQFIFLTEADSEGPVKYFAIDAEKIEKLNGSDTYDLFGQPVSPEEVGDYLELKSQEATDVANQAYHDFHAEEDDTEVLQHFSIGQTISAYESSHEYDAIQRSADLKEGLDYEVYASWVKGFNYWDGSNWKSVIVEREHTDNVTNEILDDEELIKELNQAIEDKSFTGSTFGNLYYESGNYEIVVNNHQGRWAIYEITEITE